MTSQKPTTPPSEQHELFEAYLNSTFGGEYEGTVREAYLAGHEDTPGMQEVADHFVLEATTAGWYRSPVDAAENLRDYLLGFAANLDRIMAGFKAFRDPKSLGRGDTPTAPVGFVPMTAEDVASIKGTTTK